MQLMWHNSCEEKTSNDTEIRQWESENRDGAGRAACETGSGGHGADGQKDELLDSRLARWKPTALRLISLIAEHLWCGRADVAAAEDVPPLPPFPSTASSGSSLGRGPSASAVPFALLNVLSREAHC